MTNLEIHRRQFLDEIAERLSDMEAALLELESDPGASAQVHDLFRAMHSIKGAANLFDEREILALTHEAETVFDLVRSGLARITTPLLDLSLAAKDAIWTLAHDGPSGLDGQALQSLIEAFRHLAGDAPAQNDAAVPAPLPGAPALLVNYSILFAPKEEASLIQVDPLSVLEELEKLGVMRTACRSENLPSLEEMDPLNWSMPLEIRLSTDQGRDAILDCFIFVQDQCLCEITEGGIMPLYAAQAKIQAVADQPPASVMAKESPGKSSAETSKSRDIRRPNGQPRDAGSTQVAGLDGRKLDSLVGLVGELVIAQSRLTQLASGQEDARIRNAAEEIERLTSELRDRTLSMRMLSVGNLFESLEGMLDSLSLEKKKPCSVAVTGVGTELDKLVLDELADPLAMLLRLALEQGIETPEERKSAGKPPQGTIALSAEQAGVHVVIRIRDDGRGHLTAAAEELEPVRRRIDAFRGSLELDEEPGRGAEVTIRLPLTLAIIEGLLVRSGDERFIIPLAAVEECVELLQSRDNERSGRKIISLRDEIVPYIRLREMFSIPGDIPTVEQVIITLGEEQRRGIAVDEVLGQQQVVIKNLGQAFRHLEEFAGATIQGDGSLALILDLPALLRKAQGKGISTQLRQETAVRS